MSGEEFEPLITVGEDGILYMSVGLIDLEEEEPGMVDHPLFFCPFCGTKVQNPDEVREKAGDNGIDD
jgi:predicted metal-binding protein